MNWKLFAVLSFAVLLLLAPLAPAQNMISGEIDGTVTDPTGASVPDATVTLTSVDSGTSQTTTTGQSGSFVFPLLRPGNYTIAVSVRGFEPVTMSGVAASLGKVTNAPIILTLQHGTATVEVTATAPLLDTENGNITANYSEKEISLLPSPGGDLTNYALSAPGVVLSTGAGYGNFTANGLPGTSNLYTINGGDMNDPFNNLNNSGSSNNMLGVNEVQEITVVTNGYTGEYGRAAGANETITTKSGTNQFHGNANWLWTGRTMNANDWFSNNNGAPRSFSNSNQWGGSIGGPIVKDKLFFFFDSEGLRYVLPASQQVFVPTPAFEAATLANIAASTTPGVSAELPNFQNAFTLYNGANGISRAVPIPNDPADGNGGCGDLAGTSTGQGGTFGVDTACAEQFNGGNNNLNKERLMAARVDWVATEKDKLSFRYWQDRGTQPTFTDPINPIFNTQSIQPQDAGQLTYTRIISPHVINQLIAGGFYYSAIFSPVNFAASVAASPFQAPLLFLDGAPFNNMGGTLYSYPQGRRVSQYQVVDDVSWAKGNHDFKFGVNFRGNRIADLTPFRNTTGQLQIFSMTSFFNGIADRLAQRFETSNEAGFRYYSLGLYAQDEWRITPKLRMTLSLRADRNSNESCPTGCFSRFAGSFNSLDHNINTPYNAAIQTGLKQAFPNLQAIVFQPRIGFAYSWRQNTVLRGGIGLFSDLYPGQIAERFVSNPPFVASFNIDGLNLAPGVTNSAFTSAAASNAAFVNGFSSGQNFSQIQAAVTAAGATFSPPVIAASNKNISNPQYVQWNLELEHSFGQRTSVTVNYVGNHGYDEFVVNPGFNTFCAKVACQANPGFAAVLPATAPDGRFGTVTQLTNGAISNYDGVTFGLQQHVTKGFSGQLSYTYSHSLDESSNGGLQPYSTNQTSDSLLAQINPFNLRLLNYGPSDYDFRHNFSATYIWQLPFRSENGFVNAAIGGWTISGIFHARSGQPYSVIDSGTPGTLLGNGSSSLVLGTFLGGSTGNCSSPNTPCLSNTQFNLTFPPCDPVTLVCSSGNGYGNVARNHFRGPMYFDTDMSIYKDFKIKERLTLTLGANAYNILNHPNFANPDGNLNDGTFGQIQSTVAAASSPFGNFQSSAASGRILQTNLKLQF
jgi:carboxypeptidase family protein